MRTIWKYELEITDHQQIKMPGPAVPMAVMKQGNRVCLWAEVDPSLKDNIYEVFIVGTGRPVPQFSNAKYTGSVIDGPFVWHVWFGKA